jgi:wyosine [tRNA(Phe)-imidazoG37] synthetase (radical SAM superfamily)
MSTVYGPVPSWRFGRSLGVDVLAPPKKCTFNCVYCQLGRTKIHLTGLEELDQPLIGVNQVLVDLEETLKRINVDTVDIVTFSGTGEPTLNPDLGNIAQAVKRRVSNVPLALLTNSSLLHRDQVRKNLSSFDLVVAKLDAGDDEALQLINRPADDALDCETILRSIKQLRSGFAGDLALEVMLLSSTHGEVTNVAGRPLRRLVDAILDVKPDVVQLEIPYRPPSEGFVKPPSQERIHLIAKELAGALGEDALWVYGLNDRRGTQVSWLTHASLERDAINLLKRRPCRDVDVAASLGIGLTAARTLLTNLEEKNSIAKTSTDKRYYVSR